MAATGWDPVVGDGDELITRQLRELLAARGLPHCHRLCRGAGEWGPGGGQCSTSRGSPPPCSTDESPSGELTRPGLRVIVVQPLGPGIPLPGGIKLACWPRATSPAGAGPNAGPVPRARATETFFDDMKAGDYVVH